MFLDVASARDRDDTDAESNSRRAATKARRIATTDSASAGRAAKSVRATVHRSIWNSIAVA